MLGAESVERVAKRVLAALVRRSAEQLAAMARSGP